MPTSLVYGIHILICAVNVPVLYIYIYIYLYFHVSAEDNGRLVNFLIESNKTHAYTATSEK